MTRSGLLLTNSGDETVSHASYYFSNEMILEGEIKNAKMNSFSSDFQTLNQHYFPLYFLYELLMSLRMTWTTLLLNFFF